MLHWEVAAMMAQGPQREAGLSRALPDSPLQESSARARGLDFASSSSSDPCMTSDPPLCSLDLGSPFYKVRLIHKGSLSAPPPNLVVPRGEGWRQGRHGPLPGIRAPKPTQLPAFQHLHRPECQQSERELNTRHFWKAWAGLLEGARGPSFHQFAVEPSCSSSSLCLSLSRVLFSFTPG